MKIYPLTLYYESACPLCNAEITNLKSRDTSGLLRFTDISAPGFIPQLGNITQQDLLGTMHARRADGVIVKGVEALGLAYSATGSSRFGALIRWPVIGAVAARAYQLLARKRHRIPAPVIKLLVATVFRPATGRTRCTRETGCRS